MKCSSVAIPIAFAAFVICCHVSAYRTTHSCRSFCGVRGTRGRIQCTSTSTAFLEDVPRAFRMLSRPSGNAEDVIRSDDAGVIRATRMGIVLTAFLLLRYTTAINASIASLWSFLQGYSVFRHDLFEPAVAVSSFFLWIHAWYLADSLAIKGYFPALLRRRIAAPIKKEPSESIRAPKWYVGYWYREFPVYMIPNGLGLYSEGLELSPEELPPIDGSLIKTYPMVWKNNVNGKPSLQIHGCCVKDLIIDGQAVGDLSKVRDIVYEIMRPGIAPAYVYTHDWEIGDLVIFSNRSVWHSVVGTLKPDDVRVYHQCNLAGSAPVIAYNDDVHQ